MQSKRGFALVFSLFLVLVLYTGMTVMMANLQTDLRMSKEAFRTTQSRFASQGAVNKLYSLLQNGANPQDYTFETPLEVEIGEFEKVKAWVVEDDDSGVFHLVSQFNGVAYNRVITENPKERLEPTSTWKEASLRQRPKTRPGWLSRTPRKRYTTRTETSSRW